MIAKSLLASGVALVLGVGPAAAPTSATTTTPSPDQPTAASWLADVTMTSGTTSGVQLAHARATSGAVSQAWGAPLTVNGTPYQEAGATQAKPQGTSAAFDYTDQTGSMTMTGGFTKAEVDGSGSTVRTGLGSVSGSGFAMASKLFTWDQQKRMLDQFVAFNDAVFDPLNQALSALGPSAAAAGLTVPTFTKMTALAVINVGSGDVDSATADTAAGPGMSSARAAVTLGDAQLLDGFITLNDLRATADSQSVDGDESRSSSVKIGNLTIGGVGVTVDDAGFHLLSNSPLKKATVQPTLDELYATLKEHGVTLAVDETAGKDDLREATAFRLTIASAQGTLNVTLGHVEASARSVSADQGTPVVALPDQPAAWPSGPVDSGAVAPPPASGTTWLPVSEATGQPTTGTSTASSGGKASGPVLAGRKGVPVWLGATLPAAAGRALGTVFLLLLLAGLGMALIPILLMRVRPTARRLPLIDPEVLP